MQYSHSHKSEDSLNICVYPGSFNPIHNGHIVLAEYLINEHIADEVWIVVSPQNPLKAMSELIDDEQRLQMAKIAFEGERNIKVSDIEFYLPRPSYTINTLNYLQYQYPNYRFCLLIGEDNIISFDKWKSYGEILRKYTILVYPRTTDTDKKDILQHINIKKLSAPTIDISSTEIRRYIKQGLPLKGLLPKAIIDYIEHNNLYK